MENSKFLRQKYADLNTSEEVTSAALRFGKRTNKKLSMGSAEASDLRIQNYLDRLSEVFENPDKEVKARSIRVIKQQLYDQFVIKSEKIPESYFKSKQKKYLEEGRGNLELTDEYREATSKFIIADQINSLNNWIDYMFSEEAKYSDWLKYFAVRSILHMGRYDKEKKDFTKRDIGTVAPFPDLNREALAKVLELFSAQEENLSLMFNDNIKEDVKKRFLEFLNKKNFAKLYALALEEFKPIKESLLKNTQGEWRTYPPESNPESLVSSIASYSTGWCIRGKSVAEKYLVTDKNELKIFYSLDEDGQPTVPRVLLVINNDDELVEVRGVSYQQNLDSYIMPVVEDKLKEFHDGELYKKKTSDMKRVTLIYDKVKSDGKPTKDDLIFLYEINSPIQGFGYQSDPRIAELRARNPKEDVLIFFECTSEQVAYNLSEVNENTKVYIGEWSVEISKKIPETVEFIYEKFPRDKIFRRTLEVDTKTREQFKEEMLDSDTIIAPNFLPVLDKINALPFKKKVNLVSFSAAQLGLPHDFRMVKYIYEKAIELGLEIPPPQVATELRIAYKDQPIDETLQMITSFANEDTSQLLRFCIYCKGNGLKYLNGYFDDILKEGQKYYEQFVFVDNRN